jgi:hypothetical protein
LRASTLASAVALLTVLDSTSAIADLPSLVPNLRSSGLAFAEVDRDVLVDIPTLLALIHDDDHEWFTGFDEVWICSSKPARGKPDNLRMTGDRPLETEPSGLASWMRTSTCVLGLGDGDGLNFATFDAALADLLRPPANTTP